MRQQFVLAGIILAASSLAAAAVNVLRPTPLPWIRAVAATSSQAATPPSAASSPSPTSALPSDALTSEKLLAHLAGGTAHFVDAREEHEWAGGRLRGAIHLPSSEIYKNIERVTSMVPPDDLVIVYCTGGECEASHKVADALRNEFGFRNVQIFEKGWEGIEKSGLFTAHIVKGDEP